MNEQNYYDILIIGGGPAGYAAGLYGARGGMKTVIAERGMAGGQMTNTMEIDNYPGAGVGVGGFELGDKMKTQAEHFGAETVTNEVIALDLAAEPKKVTFADETELYAKTVILAMGASPKPLGVPGEDTFRGRGVSYCATCDGMFFRNKTVAVVGGGNTALEDALVLAKTSAKVYLIHRRDGFRASPIYVELAKNTENIEFVLNETVAEICGEMKVNALKLSSGRELAVDGVFAAVGTVPNTELVKGLLTLDDGGYIPADETTKTEIPGVYAAGDIRRKPLRQVITAASDGAVAATMAERYLLENE